MFTSRSDASSSSGRSTGPRFSGPQAAQAVVATSPPPRWRHAPTSAGRHAIVRRVIAARSWCPSAIRVRIACGAVVAYARASSTISAASTPVISATRSTGYSARRRRSSSKPRVWRSTYAASWIPSSTITRISPSASAASVPGRGRTCQSAERAVRVSTGSTTTTRAPDRRASVTNGHRCWLVTIVFVPQSTTNRLCRRSSGSIPRVPPCVAISPSAADEPQIARVSRDAPSSAKKRRSSDAPCTMPCVPM